MPPEKFKRKLTAILSADVKGYSRLMGADEEATLRTLQEYKEVMASSIQHHRGKIVGGAGDSLLAEFASVVDAVQCGVEIQQVLKAKNALLAEDRRMDFRIGINLGDVIEEGETIYGDGVNIAARLESLAEPGGICISESAYQQIENKLPLRYDYMGEHEVKNITKPVRVYCARIEADSPPSKLAKKKKLVGKGFPRAVMAIIAVVVIAGAVILYQFVLRPSPSKTEVASKEKMAFPIPDKPSIAVLPFVNMSGDPKQEYFSDGMTETLTTDLSKISGLLVIARNSTFTYKGKGVKVKQVAEELGVRYVLEGSVQRAGDEIRINAQLVDAMTGHHLWAERYDGKMDRIFALQDQITQKIVSDLRVKLTSNEKEKVGQKGTNNIAAYDALLEGRDHFRRFTPDSLATAYAFFKKAVELDPNYGEVYAALAEVCYAATQSTVLLPGLKMVWPEARLRMGEYTRMAMKKPTSSAYQVSSLMYLNRRQHNEAISELERGLALDPNSSGCHNTMGWALTMAGRPKDGIEYLNNMIRLDPTNRYDYVVILAWAKFCMGEVAEAVALQEQVLRLRPEVLSAAVPLAGFYGALGRVQDARAMVELRKKGPTPPYTVVQAMQVIPFKERGVTDRYVEGLLKAGYAPEKIPGGYYPAFKENQLTGEEIKKLLFGAKTTGIVRYFGGQWWRDRKKNGESTWGGPGPIPSDSGKSWVEGDLICNQHQKIFWGLEYCSTVFRNPGGTYERKDEYFTCGDMGIIPFSIER